MPGEVLGPLEQPGAGPDATHVYGTLTNPGVLRNVVVHDREVLPEVQARTEDLLQLLASNHGVLRRVGGGGTHPDPPVQWGGDAGSFQGMVDETAEEWWYLSGGADDRSAYRRWLQKAKHHDQCARSWQDTAPCTCVILRTTGVRDRTLR